MTVVGPTVVGGVGTIVGVNVKPEANRRAVNFHVHKHRNYSLE